MLLYIIKLIFRALPTAGLVIESIWLNATGASIGI